jgi:hypothetical protein
MAVSVDLAFGYFLTRESCGKGILASLQLEALKSNRILCYYGASCFKRVILMGSWGNIG